MCDCILCFECVICLCLSCHLEILELSHRWYLYHAESPPHYLVGTGLAAKYNMSETNEFITSRQINSTEAMHILLRLHHHHNSFLIYLFFIKLLLYKSPSKTPQNGFFLGVFCLFFAALIFVLQWLTSLYTWQLITLPSSHEMLDDGDSLSPWWKNSHERSDGGNLVWKFEQLWKSTNIEFDFEGFVVTPGLINLG